MPQTPDEIILLTSNGGIADYQGDLLGLYQLMETQHNNAPIYKQLHNVSVHNKVQQRYIYRVFFIESRKVICYKIPKISFFMLVLVLEQR